MKVASASDRDPIAHDIHPLTLDSFYFLRGKICQKIQLFSGVSA